MNQVMPELVKLMARGDTSRHLYLYDTFEGMSAPTDADNDSNGWQNFSNPIEIALPEGAVAEDLARLERDTGHEL